MPLVTKLTQRLGIKHPIIQGGMHYVGYAPLAAAVSNAGGLGIVTALTQPTAAEFREELEKTRGLLHSKDTPFGINLTVLPQLKDVDYPAYVDAVLDAKIPMVETAGSPKCAELWQMLKAKNPDIVIIHKCTTIRHALKAQSMGCDMISLDGFDCAGHPGETDVGNFVLQPIAARKLDIPYVTSGGVGDGKQLAASLAMGAEGINMGTRFMATAEAPIHPGIKQALLEGDENSTDLVMRSLKNTERVYKNRVTEEVKAIEAEFPGDIKKIYHLVKGENYKVSFQETGDAESSVWSCGPVMGLIDSVPTCEELLTGMVAEAESIIKGRLSNMVA
jgi:NAD(P)H-dependent flavin oxidoreductase YrpB (nitropropane dioxygenase family)